MVHHWKSSVSYSVTIQLANITMVTRILVTMVLINTMAYACSPGLPAREPRWGKHGDYKDGEWEKKYEAPE